MALGWTTDPKRVSERLEGFAGADIIGRKVFELLLPAYCSYRT